MSTTKLKEAVSGLSDPRRPYGNLRHKLEDIVIIGLLSVICMGEDFVDMEMFGREREETLRTALALELPNGIPDSDTFRRVFECLDPQGLFDGLNKMLEFGLIRSNVINIDGKTIRGSGNASHSPYHMVSAWVSEHQITLGQLVIDKKTNEIKAMSDLLDVLDIQGNTITADALHCQKNIAAKIIDKKVDYVIGLKANQKNLFEDAQLYFSQTPLSGLKVEAEKTHRKIIEREYFLTETIDWLVEKPHWAGLNALGAVRTTVNKDDQVSEEWRYFITSLKDIDKFAYSVRQHWSVENHLHWRLDVIYGEDRACARKDNSPINMNILRKTALSLVQKADFKQKRLSSKKKRLKAALNPEALITILLAGCG